LNYRYHYKRALYLAWLASHLKGWEHADGVRYSYSNDTFKPFLNIKLKGKICCLLLVCVVSCEKIHQHHSTSSTPCDKNWFSFNFILGKVGNKFTIAIHTIIPIDVFKNSRFLPLKNNVRGNWFEDLESEAAEEIGKLTF